MEIQDRQSPIWTLILIIKIIPQAQTNENNSLLAQAAENQNNSPHT